MGKNFIDVRTPIGNFVKNATILEPYLKEIRHYSLLSQAEEQELINDYKTTGNIESRDKLIKCNLRFSFAIAKRYTTDATKLLDLYNQGNIGLINAIENFDNTKNNRFLSYAVWHIRCQINEYLSNNSTVRKTNWLRNESKVNKIKNKFFLTNGRYPTEDEIIEIFNNENDFNIKKKDDTYSVEAISINHTIDDDLTYEDSNEFISRTSSSNDAENTFEIEQQKYMVQQIMKYLSEREQLIIKMSFGIGYEREYDLDTISKIIGLTRERTRQIKNKALEKMREPVHKALIQTKTA